MNKNDLLLLSDYSRWATDKLLDAAVQADSR